MGIRNPDKNAPTILQVDLLFITPYLKKKIIKIPATL